jgi:hypothetical protein
MPFMTAEDFHKAIGIARSMYKVKRILWNGQPAFDHAKITLEVPDPENTGKVVQGLCNLQVDRTLIDLLIHPVGVPVVDGALIELTVNVSPVEAGAPSALTGP